MQREELIFSGHNNRVLLVTRKIQRPCRGLCTWPNNGRFYNDLLFQPGVQSLIKVAKFRGRLRNGRFRIQFVNFSGAACMIKLRTVYGINERDFRIGIEEGGRVLLFLNFVVERKGDIRDRVLHQNFHPFFLFLSQATLLYYIS